LAALAGRTRLTLGTRGGRSGRTRRACRASLSWGSCASGTRLSGRSRLACAAR
jgi:hypothetical protein